jgi:hypothetical protein
LNVGSQQGVLGRHTQFFEDTGYGLFEVVTLDELRIIMTNFESI